MLKRVCIGIFVLLLTIAPPLNCMASAYNAHPKLVIILAIDQLRADSLKRFQADFKPGGFNLFLHRGAYFPDCYFDDGNLAAAAASATIGTGAYTDGHSISGNQWWDLRRNAKRPVTAVEDPRYSIVGLPAGTPSAQEGASPRNLSATTLGDTVRLATQGESKLYGVSLKARAAILLAGHTANGAFWIDPASGAFITSTYYMPALPAWATAFNQGGATPQPQTPPQAGASPSDSAAGPADTALMHEFAFVQALIQGEHLGSGNVTDVLTIGISTAEIPGQSAEPNPLQQQRQSIDQLDAGLDQFFQWLDKNIPGGLRSVWIALAADRGVAPTAAGARQLGVPAATLNLKALVAALNKNMNDRFSPNQHFAYLLPDQTLPYIALNSPVFEHAGINEMEGEQAIQSAIPAAMAALRPASARKSDSAVQPSAVRLPPQPQIVRIFTRLQMAAQQPGLPPTELGRLLAHSYSPRGGWYVLLVPAAYQTQSANSSGTDFSPYSDDRHVPLAFYGSRVTPGIYRGRVGPVDLAATLAALLDINPPSASVGHILTQAMRPEKIQRPGRRTAQRRKPHTAAASHPQTKDVHRSASPHP